MKANKTLFFSESALLLLSSESELTKKTSVPGTLLALIFHLLLPHCQNAALPRSSTTGRGWRKSPEKLFSGKTSLRDKRSESCPCQNTLQAPQANPLLSGPNSPPPLPRPLTPSNLPHLPSDWQGRQGKRNLIRGRGGGNSLRVQSVILLYFPRNPSIGKG